MMQKILAFCLCLGVLAACAAGPQKKTAAKPPAPPPVPESVKKEQEARFVKDIYRALEEGDLATADALLRRVTLINPDSVEARAAQGEIFIRLSRYQEAVNVFNRLIFEKKLLARAHQGAGLANLQMNQQTLAKTHLEKAVALDDQLWRAWNGLGFYYDRRKQWKKAERSYNSALKVRSDKPSLFNNRGFSKLMQGTHESAINDFKSALRIDPDLLVARMNIRLAQAWLGRYVEAIAGASRDELPEVLNNVGYIAMLKGEFSVAEAYFSRAMERSPSYNETAANNLKKLEVLRSQSARKSKISKR
jgi:Flp pilus assembly protein TadD